MGPPPKPASQRRRQNKTNAVFRIPKTGRPGSPPPWPYPKPTKVQLSLWNDLWGTPQAVVWEHFGWTRVVARYVTTTLLAESTHSTPHLAEARQLEDRLGLSPMAMLRLRWEIVDEDQAVNVEGDGESGSVTALADYRAMFAGEASG